MKKLRIILHTLLESLILCLGGLIWDLKDLGLEGQIRSPREPNLKSARPSFRFENAWFWNWGGWIAWFEVVNAWFGVFFGQRPRRGRWPMVPHRAIFPIWCLRPSPPASNQASETSKQASETSNQASQTPSQAVTKIVITTYLRYEAMILHK